MHMFKNSQDISYSIHSFGEGFDNIINTAGNRSAPKFKQNIPESNLKQLYRIIERTLHLTHEPLHQD